VTKLAILGTGGVGGFLAAALARAGEDVVLVAREETAAVIARGGLTVRSVVLGDFTQAVPALTELTEEVDLLLVATKATGLHAALARIARAPRRVVPLLNGVEHMGVLRERFGPERVVAGTIRIESDRPKPGLIVQTSPTVRVDLAAELPELAGALQRAGIAVRIGASEAEVLWSKLVRLVALATTTAAADRPIGEIRSDPEWRTRLHGVIAEAAAVAAAEGAAIDPQATIRELDDAHTSLGSSLQRDIAAGRPSELDAIAGAVLRAGQRFGIACPALAQLSERIAARTAIGQS
jgi:2-dehydropantoate 2-reductase